MDKKKANRLKGHTLPSEGAAFFGLPDYKGSPNGVGRTRCTCGLVSEALPSRSARKRWHQGHKEAVRVERSLLINILAD